MLRATFTRENEINCEFKMQLVTFKSQRHTATQELRGLDWTVLCLGLKFITARRSTH